MVVRFKEKSVPGVEEVKPLILNATNRKTLKKMYGSDSADTLEDKKIKLYVDPKVRDPDGGGFTEGLRIRPTIPREQTSGPVKCDECSGEVQPSGGMTAAQIVALARKRFGRTLCMICAQKLKAAAEAQVGQQEAENASDD